MKKPTISYLIWNTKNNGGNRIVFEHANRLLKRGYKVEVMPVFGKQPKWFDLKIRIQNIFYSFRHKRYDILVATFWPTAWLALLIKAKSKFYFIQGWEEDFYRNKFVRMIVKRTYRFNFIKIVVSGFLEKKLIGYLKDKRSIFRLDGSGIDISIFKSPNKKNFNNLNKIKIISVISWYEWCKGPDLLTYAVQQLKVLHHNYNFTLVSCEKKPLSFVFDQFMSNIEPQKMASLYQRSHIFLATSRVEGFSLPVLEAMACGCPVITTDSGGIREFAVHNKNAIILKNISELWKEDVIERLINDRRLLEKLIMNGYKTVQKYQWDTIIDSLEKIYAY